MRMDKYLEIARFTKPQGLGGELRAQLFCDTPDILENIERFYISDENGTPLEIKFTVKETRKGFVILKADRVDSVEKAEKLVGVIIYIDREDYKLPKDTWFIADLIGLTVVDADSGKVYGTVSEILQNAPKDVYLIKTPEGKSLMFPSIPEVLIDTDITAGLIKIRPLEGLFENNED